MVLLNTFIDNLMYDYVIYRDSTIINKTNGKTLKHTKDKRRLNKSPYVKLKLKSEAKKFYYVDELMCMAFIKSYNKSYNIIHKDNDPLNCKLENLTIESPLSYIQNVLKSNCEWKKVNLDLYYDYYISEFGELFNGTTFSIVKPFKDTRKGHEAFRFNLYVSKRETIKISANRLVATHYIDSHLENKDIVYYKDGDISNLHYTNLAWGDRYDVLNNRIMLRPDKNDLENEILGKEVWKDIDIPDKLYYKYQISNFGRIYNATTRTIVRSSHGACNLNNQSWMFTSLRLKETKKWKKYLVHRLVAFHFIPNYDDKKIQINHINGNPECNWVINLEWCTPFENLTHAINTNLYHTNNFSGKVNDDVWRINIIIAWIYSIKNITIEKACRIYNIYVDECDKKLPKLSIEDF